MEKETKPNLYDHRVEQFINMTDIPFVDKACKILGNIKFEVLFLENQIYASSGDIPLKVPEGKAWIKLKSNLPAGQGFGFVFNKANDLKKEK